MSEGIGSVRTLKRKNVKGLALAPKAPPREAPSESDNQMPGGDGGDSKNTAQLEIGIEYKLDLKREDLEVLKDLGHGNGGTVSKVRHMATGTVMARKVEMLALLNYWHTLTVWLSDHSCRGKEGDAPSYCPGAADHARYQFRVYCEFLRCVSK